MALKARTLYVKEVTHSLRPDKREFEVTKLVNTLSWKIGERLSFEELDKINRGEITVTIGR